MDAKMRSFSFRGEVNGDQWWPHEMSRCFFRLLFSFRLVNKVPQSEGKRLSGDC